MLKKYNTKRIMTVCAIALVMLVASTALCFAEGDIGDEVAEGINKAIDTVKKIINPIATVGVVGCGIYCIMGSDTNNIKKAKSWGIAIFVGLLLINLAKPIVEWASSIGK